MICVIFLRTVEKWQKQAKTKAARRAAREEIRMNKLTIIERNGKLWTDSREVAAMVDKQHKHLVRDIRNYIAVMEKTGEPNFGPSSNGAKIRPVDFFIESTYINEQNREMPCFLCSKMGCEMIANKLTGQKGIQFTATYVSRFNEMEAALTAHELIYPPKCSSLGETASLVKINRTVMREQRSSPHKIARQTELFYKQAGFAVIPDFVEPNYEQTSLNTQADDQDK